MRISHKLALIVLIMIVPILVSVGLFYTNAGREIAKAEDSKNALEYLVAVQALFEHVPQHRDTAAGVLAGDTRRRARLAEIGERIASDLEAIEALDQSLGALLDSTERLTAVRRGWRSLQGRIDRLSEVDSFNLHTRLIAKILALMRHVASEGQLIANPEPEVSLLFTTAIDLFPDMAEGLGVLRGLGNGIAVRAAITPAEERRLIELAAQTQAQVRAADRKLRAAFRIDADLEEAMLSRLTAAAGQAQTFIALANAELTRKAKIEIAPDDYFAAGTRAISEVFTLFNLSLERLELKLEQREGGLRFQRNLQFGIAFALALLASVFAYFFQRGITRQIDAIGKLFGHIGIGDFEARAEVTSKDELGDLGRNLNAMLDNTLTLIQSQEERDQTQGSIQKLLTEVADVALGDLTVEAEVTSDVTGAIADSFNFMIDQLRNIIYDVQSTTLQVSSAASEIQATAEHLAAGSETQSTQIVNTSAAIEEMAASIQQVSENSISAAAVAEQALDNAKSGNEAVVRTIEGMNGIRQQVQETAKRIKRLGESSQEIGEIVQLIGDIADRTSILALNASIQAAMAGEAGRGFAVVAEEVERLAERSAEATKRIEGLIKTIQSETTEAVSAMEETTREVVAGSAMANQAGRSLEEIQGVSNRLAELIGSISMASKQQARGSESVANAMGEISQVTQQTAVGTKQAAVSIRNLAELAESLRESVRMFKLPAKAA